MAAASAGVRGPPESVFRCAIRWHILVGLSSERLVDHDRASAATEGRSMSDTWMADSKTPAKATHKVEVGTEIGGYRIAELIGQGGMGTVYLADSVAGDGRFALKVLAPELARSDEFRTRFLREGKYASSVEHPNVVRVRDCGEADGVLFMAMDYVDGEDLRSLTADGPLEVDRAVSILGQIRRRVGRRPCDRSAASRRQAGKRDRGAGRGRLRALLSHGLRAEQEPGPGQPGAHGRRHVRGHRTTTRRPSRSWERTSIIASTSSFPHVPAVREPDRAGPRSCTRAATRCSKPMSRIRRRA